MEMWNNSGVIWEGEAPEVSLSNIRLWIFAEHNVRQYYQYDNNIILNYTPVINK